VTIPTATVDRVLDLLLSNGRIARGFLGVALQRVASSSGGRGLLVIMVEPGGPAGKAGLIVGDIIVALADKPITDSILQEALDPEQVGKEIHLRILRGGQPKDFSVLVAERPEQR
jgi:S1-C subfamily serine protease